MFRFKSIQIRIALLAGLCLLVALGVLTGYSAVTMRNSAMEAARKDAMAEAGDFGDTIKNGLETPLSISKGLAESFSSIIRDNNHLTRDQVQLMLKQVLLQNPSFLGISTEWEPNAFDGMDAQYANTENTDETGHFSPYWYREGDKINLTFLPKMDEANPAYQYYVVPKNTGTEAVIDPYLYPINGKDVLMTSLMVPIMVDGKFYGVVGVDLPLDFIQKAVDETTVQDGVSLMVFSNSGKIAGIHDKPEMIGQPIGQIHQDWEQDLVYIQGGTENTEEDEGKIAVFSPIHIGSSAKPWSVNLNIPLSVISAKATNSMWLMIGIGLVLLLLAVLAMTWVASEIAKPIKKITKTAKVIAKGDLSENISVQSLDEVGQLADAFREMMGYLKDKSSAAAKLAENDLTINVTAISEKDELGSSFGKMI